MMSFGITDTIVFLPQATSCHLTLNKEERIWEMGGGEEEKDFSMCTTGLEGYRRGNSWTCNEESHLGEMTLIFPQGRRSLPAVSIVRH